MPSATAFQTNFSAGEISPRLFARVDVAKYANGCYELDNFIVQRFGGIKKRGGTQYIASTKTAAKKARVVPFIFSVTQAYILEFGDLYVRFYTNGGRVEVASVPVEVATPWNENEIFDLQFAQSADVLYITHPNHAPRTLSRTSATTFVLDTIDFKDGPYLELNTSSTTLTPAGRGAYNPTMSANNAPAPNVVASADASADAWKVFDENPDTLYSSIGATTGWIETTNGFPDVVDAYWIQASSTGSVIDTPVNWTFEGWTGTAWVVLDTRQGENGWTRSQRRYFSFINEVDYTKYRFKWTATDGGADSRIAELGLHQQAEDQTAFNLTASSVTGINDGTGFQTTDGGRPIRLLGSDGKWRWARIITRTSTTVVTIQLYVHALPDKTPISNWQLGAWSADTGFPAAVGFFNGRLCFARTATQPQTVWMSVVDDFTNFGISDPLQDDDAITATIASDSLNEIKWIAEGTDLFVGTTAAIRTIGPTSASAAFSPTNIRQKRETNFGASKVQPVRVGTTALYSGYYRKDIREIAFSFEVNGYVSQDLSILSEHIPNDVKQIAYAQNPDSVVWAVDDNGALFGMTYERDQEVIAFHTHSIGGTSVTVESVATIPGTASDEVWFVVRRTVNGSAVRYIERLHEGLSDTIELGLGRYLDSFLTYVGPATTTLTGLSHLEGQSVFTWGTGFKQGPFTVTAGQITGIPTPVVNVSVGLPYTSTMQTLSPEAAARGGTAQTRLGRISEVFLRLNRSMGGTVGPADGTQEPLDYTQSTDNDGAYGTGLALFSGDVRVPIAMEWGRQKRIKIVHSDPSPFHVLGLITEIRVSG